MPIVILVLTAVAGAIWWWIRSNPREAVSLAEDAFTTALNAPRKIAFRRQTKKHPVEGIDDARLAVATLTDAFISLEDLPTKDTRDRARNAVRSHYGLTGESAEEVEVLSHWLVEQCGGPEGAMSRVGRRLKKIAPNSWDDLTAVFTATIGDTAVSDRQKEAVNDLRAIFGQ
ncbi:MAG: hypothetical protein AAGA05_10515 [Pseudomonadota bacterium]